MTLAPGTALQNGHYVIDALLEAAPNGNLYWGTHVVVGMPVFIQVFPIGESGQSDLSNLIARLEGAAFSPQSPLPNPFQLFQGNDQTLCLAMGTTVGLPWSTACKNGATLSTQQALQTIHQLADSLAWLKDQGIARLDLSANRVWLSQDLATATLTGLPYAYLQNFRAADSSPDTSVQALAQLLCSFLTGQPLLPLDEEDGLTARQQLKQYCPNLSPIIVAAIEQGLQLSDGEPPLTLQQWLEKLPDADGGYHVQSPSSLLTRSPATRVNTVPPAAANSTSNKSSLLLPSLAVTAALAAIFGGALGTYWRLNAQSLPGAIQLDPQQSFPTQADWSGDTPETVFDAPYVPARNTPLRRDEWYEPPAPITEAVLPDEPIDGSLETDNDFDTPSAPSPLETIDPLTTPLDAPSTLPSAPVPDVAPVEDFEAPNNAVPADLEALEAPDTQPVQPDDAGFSDLNDVLTSPSPMAVPTAIPAPEMTTES
ncbi:MAG: hypothetical protein F6K00_17180 [Leptolyngbya sp. SIOISBB]|nr:hypothetical protein [Leptolyngbya sp. SIOISBB]